MTSRFTSEQIEAIVIAESARRIKADMEAEWAEYERELLYGTGDGKPAGLISVNDSPKRLKPESIGQHFVRLCQNAKRKRV